MKILEKYKKLLKYILFIITTICILIIPVSISKADIDDTVFLPILKIAIVNSYDIDHVCGTPQTQGILDGLSNRIGRKFQFDIQVWYMKTGSTFDTQEKIDYISKKVINDIKSFDPDYIFVVDDAAFKNVGIPMSESNMIFFTGLNKPFNSYGEIGTNFERFIGVEEIIPLERLFRVLDNVEFYPSKIWILSDTSTTSYYLSNSYRDEIKRDTNYDVEIIRLSRISDLRKTLSDLQKKKKGIIIHSYQNLKDDDYGMFRPKKQLIEDVLRYNDKHLDVCENCYYAKNGISMVVAPDFYNMGIQVVGQFEDYLNNKVTKRIIQSKTIMSINIKRLEELGFSWMYRKIIEEVDSSYATY